MLEAIYHAMQLLETIHQLLSHLAEALEAEPVRLAVGDMPKRVLRYHSSDDSMAPSLWGATRCGQRKTPPCMWMTLKAIPLP